MSLNAGLITDNPPPSSPAESATDASDLPLDSSLRDMDPPASAVTDTASSPTSSVHSMETSTTNPPTAPPAPNTNQSLATAGPPSSSQRSGSRGPFGPRPGVYRPCARCRSKKTKCDKVKPMCSSCQKVGNGATCVYDNDEPAPDGPTAVPVPPKVAGAKTSSSATLTSKHGTAVKTHQDSASPSRSVNSRSTKGQSPKSNDAMMDVCNPDESNAEPTSKTSSTSVTESGPPQKRHKTGLASGTGTGTTAIHPSPLRTSVTTQKAPGSKAVTGPSSSESTPSTGAGKQSSGQKRKTSLSSPTSSRPVHTRSNSRSQAELKAESNDNQMDEDGTVIDLSVKDHKSSEGVQATTLETNGDGSTPIPIPDPISTASSFNPNPSQNPTTRPKKYTMASISVPIGGSAGTYNYGQAKIIGELNSSRPTPFVIDKNQKARKWGRSAALIQTLGGEVALPLWTSSQEMLLNDPKPAFVQRPIPTSSARTGTNLARLAVLRQMDNSNTNNSTTPERGNTPESKEGSPAPQSAAIKKKRGPRKQESSSVVKSEAGSGRASPNHSKAKSLKRSRTESGASAGTDHGGAEEKAPEVSSARSTPQPTTSSRPRTFACSFEGCGKSFMDKFHLDKHEARHVTEEIVCGIDGCTKAYNSISTVRRHQSIMHKNKKAQAEEARAAAAAAAEGEGGAGASKKMKKTSLTKSKVARMAASPADSAMSAPSTRASSPSKERNDQIDQIDGMDRSHHQGYDSENGIDRQEAITVD
ncbi:hypothetical protein BGZ94_002346 [Podila epigama]|nr:hypothetical protein BGZ94_002346 [Podila epigama]